MVQRSMNHLILFLAGRTQHLSDNKCYFKCPEVSEKKKFLAPFPINVHTSYFDAVDLKVDRVRIKTTSKRQLLGDLAHVCFTIYF